MKVGEVIAWYLIAPLLWLCIAYEWVANKLWRKPL